MTPVRELWCRKSKQLGVRVHLGKSTKEVHGNGCVEQIEFNDGSALDVEMIIVSAGIRPRDDLAKQSGFRSRPARRHRGE